VRRLLDVLDVGRQVVAFEEELTERERGTHPSFSIVRGPLEPQVVANQEAVGVRVIPGPAMLRIGHAF
jgi:hypothetical protein